MATFVPHEFVPHAWRIAGDVRLMPLAEFDRPRLVVSADLTAGADVELDRAQANYVVSVLRLATGDALLIFNGRDGEWRARIEVTGRKAARLVAEAQTRPQPTAPDLALLFAPLKHARLDYVVQKAVEMGAGSIRPVLTRRTQVVRLNGERMRANAIEAAEQCGILTIPPVAEIERLDAALMRLDPSRALVFCDEEAPLADPLTALKTAAAPIGAVLIGPEGGFAPEERDVLRARPHVVRLSLGPRVLRADTAAVAALALVQAARGDWS